MISRPGSLAGLLALLIACGEPDTSSSAEPFTVADSAGVEVVTSIPPDDSAALPFDVELEIGVQAGDPEYEFHDVGSIAVDGDGNVFVANRGTGTIRVFTADGIFLHEFGGLGPGPGEFQSIDGIWIRADSLVVLDGRARRATLFRLDGTLETTWDLRRQDRTRVDIVAFGESGLLVRQHMPSRRFDSSLPLFSLIRDTVQYRILHTDTDSLGPVLGRQPTERRIVGAEVHPVTPLFEPLTVDAFGPTGTRYTAGGGRYSIDVFDPSGRLVRRITRVVPPVPVTADHVAALVERAGRGEMGTAVERAAEQETVPAFAQVGRILAAADGSLLVLRLDLADPVELEYRAYFQPHQRAEQLIRSGATRWELYEPDGRYAGAVTVPARFSPRWFDGARVIGVSEDEVGVQTIVVARIRS